MDKPLTMSAEQEAENRATILTACALAPKVGVVDGMLSLVGASRDDIRIMLWSRGIGRDTFAELDATRLALAASQATARAARAALKDVREMMAPTEDMYADDDIFKRLTAADAALAAPADESALRAVCERVATAATKLARDAWVDGSEDEANASEAVSRVLGPSGKETT